MKTAIITGISGQDGPYLAKLLLDKGYQVIGVIRPGRDKRIRGLEFLGIGNLVDLQEVDLCNSTAVEHLIRSFTPAEFYNLAALSSVGYSFSIPVDTFRFNTSSVINILEAIKKYSIETKFYQASSSEMFGDIGASNLPVKETFLFQPVSPYAISKASAHWLTINYREAFGLKACCGILFNHESCLRGSKYVIKKIIRSAIQIRDKKLDSISLGNLSVKRDWGYAPKYVEAMWLMLQGDACNEYLICSGSVVSLETFAYKVFHKLGVDANKSIQIDKSLMRSLDLDEIYGDNSKAINELGWSYDFTVDNLIDTLIEDEKDFMNWERSVSANYY